LSMDLWWSWDARARDVFRRLDYGLWRQSAHNPVKMLQQITAEYRGVRLEPKPTGIAVHLRGMDPAEAAAVTTQIEENPASWPGVHLLRGKMVLELTVVTTNKGRALKALMKANHAKTLEIRTKVCDTAAVQPRAPSLSDALGTSRVPTAPQENTVGKKSGSTFDTLTGNSLNR